MNIKRIRGNKRAKKFIQDRMLELGLSDKLLRKLLINSGLSQVAISRIVNKGEILISNINILSVVLGVSSRFLISLKYDNMELISSTVNIAEILKKLSSLNEITLYELEQVLVNPTDDPCEKLNIIRKNNKDRIEELFIKSIEYGLEPLEKEILNNKIQR